MVGAERGSGLRGRSTEEGTLAEAMGWDVGGVGGAGWWRGVQRREWEVGLCRSRAETRLPVHFLESQMLSKFSLNNEKESK